VQYLIGLERRTKPTTSSAWRYAEDVHARRRRFALAAAFIDDVMRRFDLGDGARQRPAPDGRCYGMSDEALRELYRSAALLSICMADDALPGMPRRDD
jgi:hypothetical protein